MKIRTALLFLIIISFTSCFEDRKIGKLRVKGIDNVFVNIYQEDEFDFVTSLNYEITDSDKNVILERSLLTGTEDHITDLEDFNAKSSDSILYLTWGNENEIYAIYDLKTGKGYPRSSEIGTRKSEIENGNQLVERIKSTNPNVRANWNK